jgi:octaprenyl-diphosphate synthase
METLADATLRMTEGEMLQTRYAGRIDLSVAEHLDLVERKTAALFGACCETAGMLAGAGEPKELALRRYGRGLGMAFQVVDDLLDFTGDPEVLGKPAASDLAEGKVTLPVIDLLASGTRRDRDLVAGIVANGGANAGEIARLRTRLLESGAIERARARARDYASAAAAELASFPESRARRALATVPDLLVFRDR